MLKTLRGPANFAIALIAFAIIGNFSHAQCASEANVFSFIFNNSRYELIKEEKNWAEAAACAVQRGGYLAHIESAAEQSAIENAIDQSKILLDYKPIPDGEGKSYIWIGATDQDVEGVWRWEVDGSGSGAQFWSGQGSAGADDGTTVNGMYNNWGFRIDDPDPQEPDNGAGLGSQNAAAIGLASWTHGDFGEWNDIRTSNAIYYLVEIPLATPYEGIFAWGENLYGYCNVDGRCLGGIDAISAGAFHTLALKNEAVYAWGTTNSPEDYGQWAVPAWALKDVTAIAAGGSHSLALFKGGKVRGWGDNGYLQCAEQSGVVAIAAGWDHSLAIKNSGTVLAWGGSFWSETNPVPAEALSNVSAISGGHRFSLALREGRVLTWGYGKFPVTTTANSGVSAIAAGYSHALALKAGQVIAWPSGSAQSNVPTEAGSGVVAIAAGGRTSLALTSAGKVVAWGNIDSAPPEVATKATAIACGGAGFAAVIRGWQPSIAAVSPAFGSTAGGTQITVSGYNLLGATDVTIDGTPASSFVVNSAKSITAKTPAGSAGPKTVSVTTPEGTALIADAFTYSDPPTIAAVSPASGTTNGGVSITITGANLSGTTSVTIGGVAATSVVVTNATTITAKTPRGSIGAADVAVTTPVGTAIKVGGFTYANLPVPSITTVSPTSGSTLGGSVITINGTNLAGATGVLIGDVAATNVVVNSATSLTATTPPGTAGAKAVTVNTPAGPATKSAAFAYVAPAPTIASISPTAGSTLGGTPFSITGTNLTGATSVKVGGLGASRVVVNSDTMISGITPAGIAGARDISVTTSAGTATKTAAFTYVSPPFITSISPTTGSSLGGTPITITGSNFTGEISVMVGSARATNVVVSSSTTLTAVTPAGTPGAHVVTVRAFGGSATKISAFTYIAPPAIATVTPSTGRLAGGTAITIAGTNLSGATVTIDGKAATSVVASASSINATTPAGTAGAKNVVVTTRGGSATKTGGFTYVAAPTVATVTPSSGPLTGGTAITIAGTNLANAAVTVDGKAATSVVASASSITATTPVGTVGAKAIIVTTPGGSATKASAFTYVAAPTATTITPSSGPITGGTAITIAGTNLTGASVTIDGKAATSVVASASSVTARTPSGAAGAKNVVVTTVGGSATKAGGFTYVAAPTIATVTPSSGPIAGGTSITITGTNLTGATVTIDGKAATNVVASASSISAKTPSGTVGAKSVVVTTVGGAATRAGGFTYTSSFTGGMPSAGDGDGARGIGSEFASASARPSPSTTGSTAPTQTDSSESKTNAPMGVKRYLQELTVRTDPTTACESTEGVVSAIPNTGTPAAPVDEDASDAGEPIDHEHAIDLDMNGEPDLCQLRRGDLNLSGSIDIHDVDVLMEIIGTDPILKIGDLDGDGLIGEGDVAALLMLFN
jgi:alpha-tubulin suppressor-like RCC1 family protein